MKLIHIYKRLHTWVGLACGILLFVAFYAGAFTMLKPEVERWVGAAAAPDMPRSMALDALVDGLRHQAAQGGPTLDTLNVEFDEHAPGQARAYQIDGDGFSRMFGQDAQGRLVGAVVRGGGAGVFVDELHRRAGLPLPSNWAEPLVGLVAMLYGLAIVSGVVVLWPSLVKDLLTLRLGANLKRFWMDAHNVLGVIGLPFHLAIALTTAGFCLHDVVYDVQDATVMAAQQKARAVGGQAPGGDASRKAGASTLLSASALIERARTLAPDFSATFMQYRQGPGGRWVVRIGGEVPQAHTRSPRAGYLVIDAVSGLPVPGVSLLPRLQNNWDASLAGIFALHFGSFGGWPVRVAYVCLALMGAALFYSGNLLWITSRLARPGRAGATAQVRQPQAVRITAALTVGLCVGVACGLPLTLVVMRWWSGLGTTVLPMGLTMVFYAVVALSVLVACLKGAAWSGEWLSRLAALSTWAIPLSTALGPWHGRSWLHHANDPSLGWLDGLALIGGALWWWVAARTRQRRLSGDPHSVWAQAMPPHLRRSP